MSQMPEVTLFEMIKSLGVHELKIDADVVTVEWQDTCLACQGVHHQQVKQTFVVEDVQLCKRRLAEMGYPSNMCYAALLKSFRCLKRSLCGFCCKRKKDDDGLMSQTQRMVLAYQTMDPHLSSYERHSLAKHS